MINSAKLSNIIQYEEVFEKVLNSFLFGYDSEKRQYNLKYNDILYLLKRDDFIPDFHNNIWMIYNPLFANELILLNSNIPFFRYKKLIYGFFKYIKGNVIMACTEDERFKI